MIFCTNMYLKGLSVCLCVCLSVCLSVCVTLALGQYSRNLREISLTIDLDASHYLHTVSVCYSEKDYTDAMSDDEALSGLGSVSEETEGYLGLEMFYLMKNIINIYHDDDDDNYF